MKGKEKTYPELSPQQLLSLIRVIHILLKDLEERITKIEKKTK